MLCYTRALCASTTRLAIIFEGLLGIAGLTVKAWTTHTPDVRGVMWPPVYYKSKHRAPQSSSLLVYATIAKCSIRATVSALLRCYSVTSPGSRSTRSTRLRNGQSANYLHATHRADIVRRCRTRRVSRRKTADKWFNLRQARQSLAGVAER